ncbi:MAG TPA: hypothetical protein VNW23_06610 [Opitutaceae bacterium]|jgi:ElaB/YqjD/DUF883 family membrane-anchored ribosome-binding protein|nr:hypothetical protein [Opitutaceae bacterium]
MKNNNDAVQSPKELLNELQTLVTEAEAMIAGAVTEQSSDAFDSLRSRFGAAQERFTDAYAGARKKVIAGAKYTDETIRANPYQSLAIAAGVGLIIGVLAGRSSK